MIVNLLSNIAVILINLYLIWKLGGGIYKKRLYNLQQIFLFIILESFVVFFLTNNPIYLSGVRFDFRAILFAFLTRYLGVKVSIPVVIIVSIFHLGIQVDDISIWRMGTSLVFALLLKPVYEWIKNRWTTLIQLLILLNLYILLDLPVIYKSAESKAVVWLVVLVVLIVSNLFTIFIYSVFQDVRALTKLSNRDGLTQLYNNNKFRTDIELLSKHGKQYTILIIDIDHFKKVNDTYGHLVGDDVIKKTSDILKKVSDNKYLFYRFGGDEFVTIINDVDGEQAKLLAFKIQEELKKLKVYLEDLSYITVTVSIGFAKRKEQEPLIKTFERADKALYKAKESGCNRVEIEYECPIFQESEQEPEELLNILSEE